MQREGGLEPDNPIDRIHIIPIDDIIEHETSKDCPCQPSIDIDDYDVIFMHHAFDNREIIEDLITGLDITFSSSGWTTIVNP